MLGDIMTVPYYNGYLVAIVDDGNVLKTTGPCDIYDDQQSEEAKSIDDRLDLHAREYGTLYNLPHILVGSDTCSGHLDLFLTLVRQEAKRFQTGQLEELKQVFIRDKIFEVIPTSR
jgi:hypothetical protein